MSTMSRGGREYDGWLLQFTKFGNGRSPQSRQGPREFILAHESTHDEWISPPLMIPPLAPRTCIQDLPDPANSGSVPLN